MGKNTSRIWAGIFGVVAIGAAGGVYLSPLMALNNIKNAALEENSKKLSQNVDFPALRKDLKDQISNHIAATNPHPNQQQAQGGENHQPIGIQGKLLDVLSKIPIFKEAPIAVAQTSTAMIVNAMVDKYVTPDGIAYIVQNGKAFKDNNQQIQTNAANDGYENITKPKASYKVKWDSPDYAYIMVKDKNQKDANPAIFRMRRDKILDWKLVGIKLPFDEAAGKNKAP